MRDRRTIRAALLLLPAAMLCVVPLFAQEDPADPASPERPGDRPAVEAAKTSKQVVATLLIQRLPGGVALPRQMDDFGVREVAADAGYRFEIIRWASQHLIFQGDITLVPVRDDAEANHGAVFERIADRLREHLTTIAREQSQQRLDEAGHRAEEAEREVGELQTKLRKHRLDMAGRGILPRGLEEQTARLHDTRLTLQVDLAGMRARREAILAHLTEQKERLTGEQVLPSMEEISEQISRLTSQRVELQEVLAHSEKMARPGSTPSALDRQIREQLASIEAQIAALRGTPRKEGLGSELLVGLTRQLMDVEIELAGAGARLEIVEDFFKTITSQETWTLVDSFESLEREVHRAGRRHEAARDELVKLERQHAELRLPEVRIDGVARHEVKKMENPDREGARPWWER